MDYEPKYFDWKRYVDAQAALSPDGIIEAEGRLVMAEMRNDPLTVDALMRFDNDVGAMLDSLGEIVDIYFSRVLIESGREELLKEDSDDGVSKQS